VERLVEGGVVVAEVSIPGTRDTIVLLDPERRPEAVLPWQPFQNLLRVGEDDSVRWRAELVPNETTAKCWMGVTFDGSLRAWTYSYECDIDLDSGRIVSTSFTK
jgi:hypothetical protein